MTTASRSPNLRFALAGRTAIFLDITRDRYFALSSRDSAAFGDWLVGRSLNAAEQGLLCDLLGIADLEGLRAGTVDPARRIEPARSLDLGPSLACSRVATACAVSAILVARARLAAFGLGAGLRYVVARRRPAASPATDALMRIATAHRRANRWSSEHANCLARSTALAAALGSAGVRADLVIGVKATPFGAHSWVQIGDCVVNDRPERVRPFTPIMVL